MLISFNNRFFPILKKLSISENASINDLIEEAVMDHFGISILDLNNDQFGDEEDLDPNYRFYVYAILDKTKETSLSVGPYDFEFEPFYIGKGCHNRIWSDKNELVEEKISQLGEHYERIVLKENITNKEAHRIENNLITIIGKEIDQAGPLLNYSGGLAFRSDEEIIEDLNLEKAKNLLILKALNTSKTIDQASSKLGMSYRNLQRVIKDLKLKKKDRIWSFN